MNTLMRFPSCRRSDSGFTLVEFLVYLVISVVAIGAIFQLVIGQGRLYSKQRELIDVRSSLREAAAFLAWELRQPSASGGDIYSISPDSFAVRSIQGSAIICAEHGTSLRFGLVAVSGELEDTADDSVLVFAAGAVGPADDQWRVVKPVRFWDAPGGGVASCFWGDPDIGKGRADKSDAGAGWNGYPVPDTVIEISGNMNNVYMGAPIRSFRKVQYGIYQEDGRWWLGRRVGAAAAYERLTGPLRAPQDSGLVFTWYDQAGNVTNDPADVALVEVILRGESLKGVRQVDAAAAAQQDTLSFRVALRG